MPVTFDLYFGDGAGTPLFGGSQFAAAFSRSVDTIQATNAYGPANSGFASTANANANASAVLNKALVLTAGSNPTGGDGTATIWVYYIIQDVL